MSEISQFNIDKLVDAVRGISRQEARKAASEYRTTTMGTVSRIENDGIVWVSLAGSDEETPVTISSAEVKEGEQVSVLVRNGYATITGNVSNPSVGATQVQTVGENVVRVEKYVESIKTDLVDADKVLAREIEADRAILGTLDVNYARIDAANIQNETVRNSWIDQLMVQTGLLANEGTIFTLDAIQVNASNITAGTIDVDRLIVTVNGEKYLVHVDPTTLYPTYQKLDGGVIEDLTITADKLVAGSVTAEKITAENLIGTGGWINLANGTFSYANAQTGDGISWDGQHLQIGAAASIAGMPAEDICNAANQVVYDHSYTYDPVTEIYAFSATASKGGVDVTDSYANDFFIWYLKTEQATTFLGRGKHINVPASSAIFTGSVLGALEDYLDYTIADSSDAIIQTDDGDSVYARVIWEV